MHRPSFYAPDNELFWWIEVHIDLAGSPDWMRKLYLDVRPAAVPAEQIALAEPQIEPQIGVKGDFAQIMDQTEAW